MKARLNSVKITDIAAASDLTYTEVRDDVSVEDASPEVSLATGFSRRRGALKNISLPILHASAFAALATITEARKLMKLTLTFDDGTIVINEFRGTVVPIMSAIPDMAEVFIGDMAATGDPTDSGTGWEATLGYVVGTSQADVSVDTLTDGMGRPLHNFARLAHVMELPAATLSDITGFESARTAAQVAIVHPDSTFRLYKNVYLEARRLPNPQPGSQAGSIQMRAFGAKKAWSDLVAFPASAPEDHFYGALLTGVGFHYAESSLVTESA